MAEAAVSFAASMNSCGCTSAPRNIGSSPAASNAYRKTELPTTCASCPMVPRTTRGFAPLCCMLISSLGDFVGKWSRGPRGFPNDPAEIGFRALLCLTFGDAGPMVVDDRLRKRNVPMIQIAQRTAFIADHFHFAAQLSIWREHRIQDSRFDAVTCAQRQISVAVT